MADFIAQFGRYWPGVSGGRSCGRTLLCRLCQRYWNGRRGGYRRFKRNPEHFSKCLILQVLPVLRACMVWLYGSLRCLPWALFPAALPTSSVTDGLTILFPVSPWPSAAGSPRSIRAVWPQPPSMWVAKKAGRLGEGNYSMRFRGVLRHPVPAGLCFAADERPVRSSTREKGGSK